VHSTNRVLVHGVVAGLLGATAVAVWFLVIDALTRRILFTPAALGSAVFLGATSPAQVNIGFATVAGYTLIHYAAFVAVGIIAAVLVRGSEQTPALLLAAMLLFVVAETLFVGLVAIAADWILGGLGWWAVAGGNVLSALLMGVYLWRAHPQVRENVRRGGIEAPA
jgi:hypothetical protein